MQNSTISEDFKVITDTAHYWNWAPDWQIAQEIYQRIPGSFSVLTPFAYSYLEELIRSMTSEYGCELYTESGDIKKYRKVGNKLINLAIQENCSNNQELSKLLEQARDYFAISSSFDSGNNRNSTIHGYMHSRYWSEESFHELIHFIAQLSKYAGF